MPRGIERRGNEPSSKYSKHRVNTDSARRAFIDDLINSDITSKLGLDPYCDPNINYDRLHRYLTDLTDAHLPFKFAKFNKYKHKGNRWITNGVLKSKKCKDRPHKLRRTNKSSNLYPYLKQKLVYIILYQTKYRIIINSLKKTNLI